MQNWVARNKVLSIVFVAGAAYITYRTVRQGKLLRKTRRAKRARNGGRLEVIVIAGSPTLPITKSLALDMERKGFIVYIVCNSIEEDALVQNMSRPDIKPLGIDITDVGYSLRPPLTLNPNQPLDIHACSDFTTPAPC